MASSTLKITISGVRGIIGESLSPEIPLSFGRAFGTWVKGKTVVVGMDPRPSGAMMRHGLLCGLMAAGCRVIDIGVAPTPTVQLAVRAYKAAGGVVITASHNPIQWNGLKFIRSDGIFLNAVQGEELISIYHARSFLRPAWDGLGRVEQDDTAHDRHIAKVLETLHVAKIRAKRFKVVVDVANGAGSVIVPKFLKALGAEVVVLHDKMGVPFERSPEPVKANLKKLCRRVKQERAAIGFALDADADRLALVDEKGETPGEDYTLVLAVNYLLGRLGRGANGKGGKGGKGKGKPLALVTNLSTTMAIDRVAEQFGAKVFRTRIGEVNVSEMMKAVAAPIGGEGNGGVIFSQVGFGRDSLSGMGLLLAYLAETGKPLSELARSVPRYEMVKHTLPLPDGQAEQILDRVKETFASEKLDLTDGVKILYPESWVHVRGSNTEPILRVIAEAPSAKEAERLCHQVAKLIK